MNEELNVKIDYDAEIEKKFANIIRNVMHYNKDADIGLITKAFEIANNAHKGVKRNSGEPYIYHPLEVVEILTTLELDDESLCGGFLHDVVEDVEGWTVERISEEFNPEIASIVNGLTKLSEKELAYIEDTDNVYDLKKEMTYFTKNAINLRRIFLTMNDDFRVMVIKLADRLHNMRTLGSLSLERQRRMALETIQIFAPIAHRLGVYGIKSELEDLCFKYLYPQEYKDIAKKVKLTKEQRKYNLQMCVQSLQNILNQKNINGIIEARAKNLWSIRNKMLKKHCDFENIMDLLALRVIVDTQDECYITLGVVHELWMPIPDMVTDYIAKPKPNGYQSLHTKVIGLDGDCLEVQIRTKDMHATAEKGVAAHWKYKEGNVSGDFFERKLSQLRQRVFEWKDNSDTSEQFFDSLVDDMFAEQVFVFTPRGDVLDLKIGSTPIDAAYRIHSDLGNTCVAAKISGFFQKLDTPLKNGDIVEIINRPGAEPKLEWLNFVKTDIAKQSIRRYIRKKHADEYEKLGRKYVDEEIVRQGRDRSKILTDEIISQFLDSNYKTEKDLFAAIGTGNFSAHLFVNRCQRYVEKGIKNPKKKIVKIEEKPVDTGKFNVVFDGINDSLYIRAKCCDPLIGEEVIGHQKKGKGLYIHAKDCNRVSEILLKDPEHLVEINWTAVDMVFPTRIKVISEAKMGIINNMSSIIASQKVKVKNFNMTETSNDSVEFDIVLYVKDYPQLDYIMTEIAKLPEIKEVYRPVSRRNNDKKD